MSNSKYSSKLSQSDNLPEKDIKPSSSSSIGTFSSTNSRSNSCSRSSIASTSKIDTNHADFRKSCLVSTESLLASNQHQQQLQQQQQESTNLRNHYIKNQAVNSNLLLNRHFKSQFDLPISNSTSIGSTTSLLAPNRSLLPHTNGTPYLVNNPSTTLLNYPQPAHLSYHLTQPYIPAAATVPIYDRYVTNQYPNLTVNPSNPACLVDSYLTMHSNETLAQEELFRRDHEIDRLKMKIALLEQQMNTSASAKTIQQASTTDMKLSNLEYETAMLRMEINNEVSKDEQIEKLENLLNSKEYEIEELIKKHKEEIGKLETEIDKQTKMVNSNENEKLKETTRCQQLQKENEKLQSKLNECNDYVGRLPTLDEVAEKEKEYRDLEFELETFKSKLLEQEKKCLKAKQYIREKNNEIKELRENLDAANLEKERVQLAFENYREETKEVGELMEKCAQLADLKAESETNKKLINALQEKSKAMQRAHEKEINESKEKLANEMNLVKSLEIKLSNKEKELLKTEESVKKISAQNQTLLEEKINLSEKLSTLNAAMSPETLKYLFSLFKELNLCVKDLNELVTICIDFYHGKQIDVNYLLGYSKDVSYSSFDIENKENGMLSLVDTDYLVNKTNEIKNCRHKLTQVRHTLCDEYAEKVGNNMSCITQ